MSKNLFRLLWMTGIRLKCPACEQGDLFKSLFAMNKTCANCGVRFQRDTGEETGGMTVSIVVVGLIFLIGYPLMEVFTDWPLWVHFAIWLPFCVIFPIFFYRYSRAFWLVFLYTTNAVRPDRGEYRDTDLTLVDAFRYRRQNDADPEPPVDAGSRTDSHKE